MSIVTQYTAPERNFGTWSGVPSLTPHTDRGVTDKPAPDFLSGDVKFSLDWLTVTIWAARDWIFPLLQRLGLDQGLKDAPNGGRGFRRREDGLNGFQLYSRPVEEEKLDGVTYCSLSIPAKALHNIGQARARAIVGTRRRMITHARSIPATNSCHQWVFTRT